MVLELSLPSSFMKKKLFDPKIHLTQIDEIQVPIIVFPQISKR